MFSVFTQGLSDTRKCLSGALKLVSMLRKKWLFKSHLWQLHDCDYHVKGGRESHIWKVLLRLGLEE